MLHLQRARSAYDAGAATIPPAHQLVMLYDGAIRRLHQARDAIREGRIEDRHTAVRKAHAIVDALHNCLDRERGGQVAAGLDRLYGYLLFKMTRIDIENDPAICEEIAARLGQLRDAWAGVAAATASPAPLAASTASGRALSA